MGVLRRLVGRPARQPLTFSLLSMLRRVASRPVTRAAGSRRSSSRRWRVCATSTPEMIRRRLHDLRDWGWLDFQAGDGGDPAWKIWLTGLSLEEPSPRPLHDLSTETPPPQWRGLSTDSPPPTNANPHGRRIQPPPTSPQSETRPLDRRYETRREENHVRREDEVLARRWPLRSERARACRLATALRGADYRGRRLTRGARDRERARS